MSGPQKILELDGKPEDEWQIDSTAVHLYQNNLWNHIPTGCVLCIEAERSDPKGQSLSDCNSDRKICLTHGQLTSVPYSIRREVTISFGHIERKGHQLIEDVVLIPAFIQGEELTSLIERLLDAAEEEERSNDLSVE